MHNSEKVISAVVAIIAIVGFCINLPILQYNVKDFSDSGEIPTWSNTISPIVWNSGPMVIGASIYAPQVCMSVQFDQNISCYHVTAQNSKAACESQVCSNVPKGGFFSHDFILEYGTKLDTFDFNVLFDGKPQPSYSCKLKEYEQKYECKKN